MRLHLIDLLGLGPSPCLLPSALAHHVETGRAHHKKTTWSSNKTPTTGPLLLWSIFGILPCQSPYGGPGENRTPVHSAFTWKELQQFL